MATMSLQAAYDQARSYLEANQVEQAVGVAQHILVYFPENLEAHRILGEAFLAGRQFDQAEQAFQRVLRSDPESIPAHVGLGITYERQGRIDQAVAEFEQALEVRPDMPELRGQLLRLYTDMWGLRARLSALADLVWRASTLKAICCPRRSRSFAASLMSCPIAWMPTSASPKLSGVMVKLRPLSRHARLFLPITPMF